MSDFGPRHYRLWRLGIALAAGLLAAWAAAETGLVRFLIEHSYFGP